MSKKKKQKRKPQNLHSVIRKSQRRGRKAKRSYEKGDISGVLEFWF